MKTKEFLIQSMTQAFYHDPVVNFLLQDQHQIERWLPSAMQFIYELCGDCGEIITAKDKAIACCLPSSVQLSKSIRFYSLLLVFLKNQLLRLKASDIQLLLRSLKLMKQVEKYHYKPEHLYLFVLAVDPNSQGQGLSREIFKELIAKSETLKLPIYLENSNVDNLSYYQHMGFNVTKEIKISHGPSIWGMLRPLEHQTN